jgi:hypothetical protein
MPGISLAAADSLQKAAKAAEKSRGVITVPGILGAAFVR